MKISKEGATEARGLPEDVLATVGSNERMHVIPDAQSEASPAALQLRQARPYRLADRDPLLGAERSFI